MALYLRQDEQRSEVQKRVATELQDRLRDKTKIKTEETDPAVLDGQHTTSSAGMVMIVLFVLLMIAIIVFAVRIS